MGAKALATAIEKSASLQRMALYENKITNEDVVWIALARAKYRRQILAWACGGGSVVSPTRKLLRGDGDHAIGTRVAEFLLDSSLS